jgi:hypothetical protein
VTTRTRRRRNVKTTTKTARLVIGDLELSDEVGSSALSGVRGGDALSPPSFFDGGGYDVVAIWEPVLQLPPSLPIAPRPGCVYA